TTALNSASSSSSGLPLYSVCPAAPIPPPVNCCSRARGLVPVSHIINTKTPAITKPVLENKNLNTNPIAKGENPPPPKEPDLPRRSSTLLLLLLPCHFIWYNFYCHYQHLYALEK